MNLPKGKPPGALGGLANKPYEHRQDYHFLKQQGGVERLIVKVQGRHVTMECGHGKTVSRHRQQEIFRVGKGRAQEFCFVCKCEAEREEDEARTTIDGE